MNSDEKSNVAVASEEAAGVFNALMYANASTACEQPVSPLPPEKQAEFCECVRVIYTHKKHVPEVARAIATIEREGYYLYCLGDKFKSIDDFIQKVFGFDRTYIFRMKKFGSWLKDNDIPKGKEPSETSVRDLLQNCFSDEDRKTIYRNAQKKCFSRQEKTSKSNAESSGEKVESDTEGDPTSANDHGNDSGTPREEIDCTAEICQTVPEAKDIRQAIRDFKEGSDRVYLPQLDKSYPKEVSFTVILSENADKFTTTGMVLGCFKLYKTATNMTAVDKETEQSIREYIRKLIEKTEAEMNDLLQNPSSVTENNAD